MKTHSEHIDDSFLRKLPVEGGFDVPENYFEQLSSSVLQNITLMGKADPELSISEKEDVYLLPDNYFEQAKQRILSKTINKPKARIIPVYRQNIFRFASGIAAIFIAVIIIFVYQNKVGKVQYSEKEWNNISDDEMISHLESSDVSPEVIDQVLFTGSQNNMKKDDSDIEQYLIDQGEEQTLTEEL